MMERPLEMRAPSDNGYLYRSRPGACVRAEPFTNARNRRLPAEPITGQA